MWTSRAVKAGLIFVAVAFPALPQTLQYQEGVLRDLSVTMNVNQIFGRVCTGTINNGSPVTGGPGAVGIRTTVLPNPAAPIQFSVSCPSNGSAINGTVQVTAPQRIPAITRELFDSFATLAPPVRFQMSVKGTWTAPAAPANQPRDPRWTTEVCMVPPGGTNSQVQRVHPGAAVDATEGCDWSSLPVRFQTSGADPVIDGNIGGRVGFSSTQSVGLREIEFGITLIARYTFERAAADLMIDHIEAVQVVQDANNTVPLIAGKPTVVRVFPKIAAGIPVVTGVTAELTGTVRGAPLPGSPLRPFNGPVTARSSPSRGNADDSLNFSLPVSWIQDPAVSIRAEAKHSSGQADPAPANNAATVDLQFQPSQTLRIAYLPFCYELDPTRAPCPSDASIAGHSKLLERMFPISPGNLTYTGLALPRKVLRIPNLDKFVGILRKFYNSSVSAHDQFTAWLPDLFTPTNFTVGGLSDPLFDGGEGHAAWGQDFTAADPDYPAFVLAHETAHNLGRRHTNLADGCDAPDPNTDWRSASSQTGEIGFDPIARVLKPANKLDLMTNCAPSADRIWMSAFTYTQLIRSAFRPQSDGERRFAEGDWILVAGTVKRDGSGGTLEPAYRIPAAETAAPRPPQPSHCVRFQGASGTLGEQCVALTFRGHRTQNATLDEQSFSIRAPLPAGTTRIALYAGDKELAALSPGPGAPQVSIVTPQPNDVWNGGSRTITWSGSDPDNDPLTYAVLYSTDAGSTWLAMEIDTQSTQYTFSPDEIDGGKTVRFRVLATDGINNATAEVGPIEVVQNPRLLAAANRLDFRKVVLRQVRDLPLVVSNGGTGPLRITSLATGTEEFTLLTRTPVMIPAGQSLTITVRFSPEQAGLREARLAVASTDAAQPTTEVILSGRGIAAAEADLNVPARIEFGHVPAGSNKDVTLAIRNDGGAALTVNTLTFNNAAFRVVSPAAPLNIAAGATTNVTLRFVAGAGAGDQNGQLTIASTDPSAAQVVVAVAATVVTGVVPASSAAGVVSAASFLGGPVAAGEIVTIFGSSIGPPAIAGLRLNAQGLVDSTAGETRVLFDGVAAPIIYALAGQTSAIVPYAVAGRASTQMVVEYQGRRSDPVTLPVAPSAPSLFSADSSGRGPGAILNQDGSVNTPGNPADKDSVIVLFGTGEGRTEPEGVDGRLATSVFPKPRLAVTATVGGLPAEVLYAGAAPGLVSGVLQVNVKIPPGVASGNVPVAVTIGVASSQGGLTVAVR